MASQNTSEVPDVSKMRLGFIGAGRMGQAMAKGIVSSGLMKADQMCAADTSDVCLKAMEAIGVGTTKSNGDVVAKSDIVVIAVKPDIVCGVLEEVAGKVNDNHLFVSIAAGITLSTMEKLLPGGTRCTRVMPNTPALVQSGASAFCLGRACGPFDASVIKSVMGSVGLCHEVPKEKQLDAITGMSGSGPAYCFQMIEAMSDGGVKMGLPRDLATQLSAQTLLGAARMVLESGRHPGQLKDDVCSPAGTSIAGIHALEKGGFRAAVISAVEAATVRSQQLGEK